MGCWLMGCWPMCHGLLADVSRAAGRCVTGCWPMCNGLLANVSWAAGQCVTGCWPMCHGLHMCSIAKHQGGPPLSGVPGWPTTFSCTLKRCLTSRQRPLPPAACLHTLCCISDGPAPAPRPRPPMHLYVEQVDVVLVVEVSSDQLDAAVRVGLILQQVQQAGS